MMNIDEWNALTDDDQEHILNEISFSSMAFENHFTLETAVKDGMVDFLKELILHSDSMPLVYGVTEENFDQWINDKQQLDIGAPSFDG